MASWTLLRFTSNPCVAATIADPTSNASPRPSTWVSCRGVRDTELKEFGAFHSVRDGLGSGGQTLERALAAGLPSLSRSIPDILSVAPIRIAPKANALGRDSWYPALRLMTARAKGGESEGFYLAVQAARNALSHGHNDSG